MPRRNLVTPANTETALFESANKSIAKLKTFMRFTCYTFRGGHYAVFNATVLALVTAQEAPEGYVSKELIERLFKAARGGDDIFIGELSPLFSDYAVTGPEGLELLGSTQEEYRMYEGFSQEYARAYFDTSENGDLTTFNQSFSEDGWTSLTGPVTTDWGFIGPQQFTLGDYGSYCKGNATVNFGSYGDETIFELSLEVNTNIDNTNNANNIDDNACEQQIRGRSRTIAISGTVEGGIDIPDLQLSPPATSVALIAEMLPYSPVPKSPGGLGSRTTLSTTLAPSRVLELYNLQMERAGWTFTRSNTDEIHDWSEWTFTDEAGQDWLATINVTHHEAYPNLVMPILIVLEK
jgi:hypothetical protein